MNKQENVVPTIMPVRFQIQRNWMLDGTSADMRFLASLEHSTITSAVVFEVISEQEQEYQPFMKPSAIIEELQGQSI